MQANISLPAAARPLSIRRLVGNRFVLSVAALALIAAAAAWQWSWLLAIGVAPLLISVAPCAAMCGLGLCMHRISGRGCNPSSQGGQGDRPALESPHLTKET